MTVDKNIEQAQLQAEIGKYIGLGQNSSSFIPAMAKHAPMS
jgi:hypothetical protein